MLVFVQLIFHILSCIDAGGKKKDILVKFTQVLNSFFNLRSSCA